MLQVSLKKNFGLLNGYEEFMKKIWFTYLNGSAKPFIIPTIKYY